LKEFEEWAHQGQELTKKDLEFLHASVKKHEREARNKTIKLQFIFGSLLVSLIGGFLVIQWYQFQQQYQQKIAQNLMLISQQTKENNRQKRILLQLEALRLNPTLPIPLNFYRDLAKIPNIQQIFTHNDQVNVIEVSPDGQKILTGSLDGNAYLWQIDGKLINKLNHDDHSINTVTFSADGNYFATASIDGIVKIWRKNGKLTKTFKHDNSVNKIAFSPNHNYLATVSADSKLKLWNLNTGKITSLLHKGNILSLAFSPTHPYLITGSLDKTAKVWNFEKGENIKTIEHKQGVNQVIFSHDSKFIITGSSDGIVQIINLDGQENYQLQHSHGVLDIAVSYDNKKLVTVSENVARVWNLEDIFNFKSKILTENYFSKDLIHEKKINQAIFTENNQHLITVADDFQARVWKIDSDNNLSSQIFHDAPVVDIETVNHNNLLTASWDKTVRLWDILPNNEIEVISFPFTIAKSSLILDQKYLSILDENNKVRGINLEKNQFLNSNVVSNQDNKNIWSSQGNYLAIIENELVKVWQKNDKNLYQLIAILPHVDEVHYLEFSPDEQYLFTASDDWKTRFWELKRQMKMDDSKIIFEKYADYLTFSSDSNFLAISSQNNRSFIFDIKKQDIIKDENGKDQEFLLERLKFSPDSKLLLTFGNGNICFNHGKNFSHKECQGFLDATIENIQWIKSSEYLGIIYNQTKLILGKINNVKQSQEYKFQKIVDFSFKNEIKTFDIGPNGEYLAIVTQDDKIELRKISQPSKILLKIETEEPIKAIRIGKKRDSVRLNIITSKDIVQVPLWDRQTLLHEKACRILNHNLTKKEWEMLIEKSSYRSTCLSD
ncbi:MAG: WD40 repeat domain-containing protein, partial [Crocosphaera sp.]